jgi:hypothetical protein
MLGFMHRGVFILGRMRLSTFMLIKVTVPVPIGNSICIVMQLLHPFITSKHEGIPTPTTYVVFCPFRQSKIISLDCRLLKVLAKLTWKKKDLGRCRYRHVYRKNQLIVWISTVATVWAKLRPGHCGWFPAHQSGHFGCMKEYQVHPGSKSQISPDLQYRNVPGHPRNYRVVSPRWGT